MGTPSNYPPGVSGNEPEISGIWPDEDPLEDWSEVAEAMAETDPEMLMMLNRAVETPGEVVVFERDEDGVLHEVRPESAGG